MRFVANTVQLQLHTLAYNLADFLRIAAAPELIETGTRHVRYAVFQMAQAALPRSVFAGILGLINGLRGATLHDGAGKINSRLGAAMHTAGVGRDATGGGQNSIHCRARRSLAALYLVACDFPVTV